MLNEELKSARGEVEVLSEEYFRDRVGKFLLGPGYNPDKSIPRQIVGLVQKARAVPEKLVKLTREEEEALAGEYSSYLLIDMSLQEKKRAAKRLLEERLKPYERSLVSAE